VARIKIEDLQTTETLTPEEEALVEGAGLRPFRPALEGLEDRQLMASHLAALPVQPPAPDGASVGQVLSAPRMEVDAGLMASAVPQREVIPMRSAPRGDDTRALLESQVRAFLKDSIITPFNRWAFCDNGVPCVIYTPSPDGNKVEMSFKLRYYIARRPYECNLWMVFQGRMEGGEKVFSLTRAGLSKYAWNSDAFEAECKTKFQEYFGSGIHTRKYTPNAVDLSNVVRAASSQFMRDVAKDVIWINQWRIQSLVAATGAIEGSTIHVDLEVGINKDGRTTTYHTLRLSFEMEHQDPKGGRYFKIVGFQCNDDIDGKQALRDRVISAFTDSRVYVGAIPPKAAEDIARRDLDQLQRVYLNGWRKNLWHIKSAELDSVAWSADGNHLYVYIKLTREGGFDQHGLPTMTFESTLIIEHTWRWEDGGRYVKCGSRATVETNGRTDISLAVLTTLWTYEGSEQYLWHKYDKDGNYQGDVAIPTRPPAALEAQARTAPAVRETAAPLAGLAPQTTSAPPGASFPRAAKPADGATGMNDLAGSGPTDAYFASLGRQERKKA
jgi:hypothetical protein